MKGVMDMRRKLRRYFGGSIAAAVVICLVTFFIMTIYMSSQTENSLDEIGEIYMSEMSKQLQQKYQAITNLRLSQMDSIRKRVPPAESVYGEEMLEELKMGAESRDFCFLSLYSEDGEAERIIGNPIEIKDYNALLESLAQNGQGIAMGKTEDGEKHLLLAVTAAYPLKDGGTSSVLIAGVSMEYLNEALFLDEEKALMYSHLIAKDGTFVIRNSDAYRDNYFERTEAIIDDENGKDAKEFNRELKEAMEKDQDYSTVLWTNGQENHIYCARISADMEWYLISVMPSGVLNDTISGLDEQRFRIVSASFAIIFLTLLSILIMYHQLSKKQLREQEKSRQEAIRANMAKSDFLSSMSHDIRTPMNAITGMTEIALKNLHDPERIKDYLEKIKLSNKHLLGLINDVLDMSKIESGKMKLNLAPMSLREVMDDIVNIVRPQVRERQQSFDIFIHDIISENVCCDEIRLNQVLLNLVSNALKFTPEKGSVWIYLYQKPSEKGEDYIQTHMVVEDTGIGMSEEFQKKIFDTFEREDRARSIAGTGLGMAITHSIVTLMGGEILVESEEGKGSKFHVIVDFRKADEMDEEMRLPQWNVLVVDDDEMLCNSAVSNLKELGVNAEWTLDGRQAVEMIEERHNKGEDYKFVLIDWKMPNMNGLQTIREIRKRAGCDMPIFLISAYDWGDLEEEFSTMEIEGFISKPLFKSKLHMNLKKYVEGTRTEPEETIEQIDFQGKRLLMAEDIDINWEVAYEVFTPVGLILDRAENGKECLETFEASEPGYYEAILMDIRMPVMDGYEATRAIRKLDREDSDLPIIAMTADAFSDDAQRCFDSGMDAHLTKPLDIQECMRTLKKYLFEKD